MRMRDKAPLPTHRLHTASLHMHIHMEAPQALLVRTYILARRHPLTRHAQNHLLRTLGALHMLPHRMSTRPAGIRRCSSHLLVQDLLEPSRLPLTPDTSINHQGIIQDTNKGRRTGKKMVLLHILGQGLCAQARSLPQQIQSLITKLGPRMAQSSRASVAGVSSPHMTCAGFSV
jgi:hypothetical protein